MSKGDSPRPHDPARYRSEWERIFHKQLVQRAGQLRQERDTALYGNDPARGETGEEGGAT